VKKEIDFRLYAITDRKLITRYTSLITAVSQALSGGVRAIQLREKDLETRELLKLTFKMRELTYKYDAKLFINDRFDVALAAGADVVHLTQNSIPAEEVRKTVRKKLLIGVSTHSLKEAKDAEKEGADFITFGPVYRTQSKIKYGRPVGLDALRQVCRQMKLPVFALGGIKTGRIKKVQDAGAYGVSMISEIFKADNIKQRARELVSILTS
jgi:thiamine-phosphate pyrophosphorylase